MCYLKYFPQPFLDDLVAGRVLPVVGAGLSKNAVPPLSVFSEVAKELAQQIPGYVYMDPIDAVSAYEFEYSRLKMVEEIAQLLNRSDVQPGPAIEAFAKLPFEQVVTTNWEHLLERAYAAVGREAVPLVEETQLSSRVIQDGVSLLKIHGDFNNPARIIATEKDYDGFSTNYPLCATYLAYLLIVMTPLFVGYSLSDYDFRFVYRFVEKKLYGFRRPAYTIQVSAGTDDLIRFRRRGIIVINLPGDPKDYRQILTDTFSELKKYWQRQLIKTGVYTGAKLPPNKDIPEGLCLIAADPHRIGFYRQEAYPVLTEANLVPITAADLHTPDERLTPKMAALAGRAAVLIADRDYRLTDFLVKERSGAKTVLVIAGEPMLYADVTKRLPSTTSRALADNISFDQRLRAVLAELGYATGQTVSGSSND